MIVAERPWDVRVTSSNANARRPWDVRLLGPDTEANREWDVEVDGSLGAAALGTGGEQTVAMRVLVDGVELDPRLLVTGISVRRGYDGSTASFSVASREDLGTQIDNRTCDPLGNPLAMFAPAGGLRKITIQGGYVTSLGVKWIPLLTDGIVDNSTRRGGVDVINVVDKMGRYDRVPATLILEPGHGTTRDLVIQELFESVGWEGFALEPMEIMNKELQAVDVDAVATSRDLADTESRAVFVDRFGDLVNPRRLPKGDEPTAWVLHEGRLLETPSVAISARSDVPTAVCLEGSEQVIRDDCGRRLERSFRESFTTFAPVVATRFQDGAGAISSITNATVSRFGLFQRVTTELEYECATLLSKRTIVERWFNRPAARYNMAEDDAITSYWVGVYFTDSAVVKDDSTPGFAWPSERFVVVSDILESYVFDDNGKRIEDIVQRAAWFNEASARIDIGAARNVAVTADGRGVANGAAQFQLVEQKTLARDVTDDGFVSGTVDTVDGWHARAGIKYQYADGRQARDPVQLFQEKIRVEESLDALFGDSGHSATTITTPEGEEPVVETEDRGGFLPAAPELDISAASRTESQRIEHLCTAPWLEQTHVPRTLKASSEWAENSTELASECARMLREGVGLDFSYATFANFLMRRSELHHLIVASDRINHDVWTESVEQIQVAPSGLVMTKLSGRVFPDAD